MVHRLQVPDTYSTPSLSLGPNSCSQMQCCWAGCTEENSAVLRPQVLVAALRGLKECQRVPPRSTPGHTYSQ